MINKIDLTNGGSLYIRPGNAIGAVAPKSIRQYMIIAWMLAMAFGSAGFIWFGIASSEDPALSITLMAVGIFLVFLSVARIVKG
jgi:ABC-type Mn2+/Zn2+ transport system permease subunit